ncbi:hypothetical protein [Actinokineospora sp. NBRC 105648]|uniref:hypothetical protein n=1 Tax=Actinokineospora sp. NBRC 105648 TaxID=3032206 RepID=UPI0024A3A4E8|nr:hypothetical protein [Actinokineospora sp. NBRC 105648]GLZ36571.1 hypothetical protein Acsp05_01960 [Actinokineospora sp. NBRC 105648]
MSPLRNRVAPDGELIATAAHGAMFGNRGVLHDASGEIVRQAQVKRWLVCELSFRERWRPAMTPNRYTGLFFLDEAVALAAGHRPCAECRHADYQRFRAFWAETKGLPGLPRAADIDAVLDDERKTNDGRRRTIPTPAKTLPDGVFVEHEGHHWLVHANTLHRWTPGGYSDRRELPTGELRLLTPPSTAEVISAGFRPRLSLVD